MTASVASADSGKENTRSLTVCANTFKVQEDTFDPAVVAAYANRLLADNPDMTHEVARFHALATLDGERRAQQHRERQHPSQVTLPDGRVSFGCDAPT